MQYRPEEPFFQRTEIRRQASARPLLTADLRLPTSEVETRVVQQSGHLTLTQEIAVRIRARAPFLFSNHVPVV